MFSDLTDRLKYGKKQIKYEKNGKKHMLILCRKNIHVYEYILYCHVYEDYPYKLSIEL